MKRSWRREDAKKSGPALHTDRNFIRNWFPVCKLGYSRKRWGLRTYFSFKKTTTGISKIVISPLKILDKSYSSLKNPAKLCDTYWEWSQILCDFFFIAPENFSYFLFSPRKFHIVFLQYSWKIQVLE